MTYLGLDYGEANVGIAILDLESGVVTPLKVLSNNSLFESELTKLVQQWEPKKIIAGLPLLPDGTKSPKCLLIERFVRKLARKFDLDSDFYPEYFSTKASNQGLSRKQKQVLGDAYAAAHILQKYWEWQQEKSSDAARTA